MLGNVHDNRGFAADPAVEIEVIHDITGPASYATGGFTPDLKTALDLPDDPHLVECHDKAGGTHIIRYDYTNKKILMYDADGTQKANTSDQSAIAIRCVVRAAKKGA